MYSITDLNNINEELNPLKILADKELNANTNVALPH